MSITSMESSTIQAIPENQRHGNARDLFTIWFGSNIMLLTMFTTILKIKIVQYLFSDRALITTNYITLL